jgi:hypothetical protein
MVLGCAESAACPYYRELVRVTKEHNGMDLHLYYQKIRDQEAAIPEEFPVVVSHDTADGGKAGHQTEVPRRLAAKLIVEGVARLANNAEAQTFRDLQAEAKRAADQLAAAAKVQLAVMSALELDKLRGLTKSKG